jgi:hypothetical protein
MLDENSGSRRDSLAINMAIWESYGVLVNYVVNSLFFTFNYRNIFSNLWKIEEVK